MVFKMLISEINETTIGMQVIICNYRHTFPFWYGWSDLNKQKIGVNVAWHFRPFVLICEGSTSVIAEIIEITSSLCDKKLLSSLKKYGLKNPEKRDGKEIEKCNRKWIQLFNFFTKGKKKDSKKS